MKVAVICSVYNEKVLLPQFLEYYSPQVDTIFLLDNESTDRSLPIASWYPNVVVSTYASGGMFSDAKLSDAYDKKRAECAGRYDYVILADCDEFIVAKSGRLLKEELECLVPPKASGLFREFFWTHGYNMWAKPDDHPYDPAIPLIAQRQFGIEDFIFYSKPSILRPETPLKFCHGRHNFLGIEKPSSLSDAPFYLLHYAGFDEDIFVKRGLARTNRFSEDNIALKTSFQHREKTEESYREHFRQQSSHSDLVEVPIPHESLRPILKKKKLNIGAGGTNFAGYDTLDRSPEMNPTYCLDLLSAENWNIPEELYDEVLAVHVIEHLPLSRVSSVLARISKLMKSKGVIRIHVPNGPLTAKVYLEQPANRVQLQPPFYGAEAETNPAFAHKVLYDFDMLASILKESGFARIEDVTHHYEDYHDPYWAWMGGRLSLKVRARKP